MKKTLRYLAWALLTLGASLILGFLSFSGLWVLLPSLPWAFTAMALAVSYEGEIYLQNIKGAWKKLFGRDYLEINIARACLLELLIPENIENAPQFFKDYKTQLESWHKFTHAERLDDASLARRAQVEKTLGIMEQVFARMLFESPNKTYKNSYKKELHAWINDNNRTPRVTNYREKRSTHNTLATYTKIFSTSAAIFMGLGTSYLLVEAFAVIPLCMALPFVWWPLLIVPMASIAAIAYGFLTYNTIINLISNETIQKWLKQEHSPWTIALTILISTLALSLTICTAGTWWTVAQTAQPLFKWMGKIPKFIMGVINPLITVCSSLAFNLQNSLESLEQIISFDFVEFFSNLWININWREHENFWQIINPFSLILTLIITPLRILFFLGHVISVGFTADRMPGLPEIVSAFLGGFAEGLEDSHYFFPHGAHHAHETKDLLRERLSPGHSHSHDANDIPTRIIKYTFYPIYLLATVWDWSTSKLNAEDKQLSFEAAWERQLGVKPMKTIDTKPNTSDEWKKIHVLQLITNRISTLEAAGGKKDVKKAKISALTDFKASIQNAKGDDVIKNLVSAEASIAKEKYGQHRFFSVGKTSTEVFIEGLNLGFSYF